MISAPTKNETNGSNRKTTARERTKVAGYHDAFPCMFHNAVDAKIEASFHDAHRDLVLNPWIRPSAWMVRIVNEALSCGLRVSIACPPEYAVQLTGIVAQLLGERTWSFYDADATRVVFYSRNEDKNREKHEVEVEVA